MQDAMRHYSDELRRAHGVEVQIRVGVNSGDVVVRSIGGDLRMDYTAVGQTTHLAARMEQLAAPSSIRFTAETLQLAEDSVQGQVARPVPIKGLGEPVQVFLICHGLLASRARWRERVVAYGQVEPGPTVPPLVAGLDGPGVKSSLRPSSWAALMHRAFAIDVLACPHCGGRLRLIATLHDAVVIRKLLAHLGLARSGPSHGPGPPEPGAAAR